MAGVEGKKQQRLVGDEVGKEFGLDPGQWEPWKVLDQAGSVWRHSTSQTSVGT